ncbi:MAG TPA: 16S rRNA (guanine(527)-N(7))-methyltransferase RsmG [Bacteroidia bacterium]|nr:16S rRNA (guanine(527)-N(7))-methyltransferase RsmG [Bacteroidia bacterium]
MKEILQYFPELTPDQQEKFFRLKELYEFWNAQINVISRKDMDNFYVHHVLHSLAIAKIISFKPGTEVLDVGTGGGFPGIPLAILFPEVNFHLVDSIGKKIKVVNEVANELGLKNVKAEHKRVEELKGQYDFIVSRAVAPWNEIHAWTGRLLKRGGNNTLKNGWILLKGGDLTEELFSVKNRAEAEFIYEFFKMEYFLTKKVVYISG